MSYRCTLLPRDEATCYSRDKGDARNQHCPKGQVEVRKTVSDETSRNCCECEAICSCTRNFICIDCNLRFDCHLSCFYGKSDEMAKNFVGEDLEK